MHGNKKSSRDIRDWNIILAYTPWIDSNWFPYLLEGVECVSHCFVFHFGFRSLRSHEAAILKPTSSVKFLTIIYETNINTSNDERRKNA